MAVSNLGFYVLDAHLAITSLLPARTDVRVSWLCQSSTLTVPVDTETGASHCSNRRLPSILPGHPVSAKRHFAPFYDEYDILERFEVSTEQALRDVQEFAQQLLDSGLAECCG